MDIYGMVTRPCSTTLRENEKVIKSAKYFTDSDFYKKYSENIAANQIIAESAKIYILKNYKKVKDWGNIKVDILDNTGKETKYYKHTDKGWNTKLDFVKKMLIRNKANQNPVISLTKVVLDPTDGDFSLTINKKDHLWIDDGSIIVIADYIEQSITTTPTKGVR